MFLVTHEEEMPRQYQSRTGKGRYFRLPIEIAKESLFITQILDLATLGKFVLQIQNRFLLCLQFDGKR